MKQLELLKRIATSIPNSQKMYFHVKRMPPVIVTHVEIVVFVFNTENRISVEAASGKVGLGAQ